MRAESITRRWPRVTSCLILYMPFNYFSNAQLANELKKLSKALGPYASPRFTGLIEEVHSRLMGGKPALLKNGKPKRPTKQELVNKYYNM
jgi:hypothetical protein